MFLCPFYLHFKRYIMYNITCTTCDTSQIQYTYILFRVLNIMYLMCEGLCPKNIACVDGTSFICCEWQLKVYHFLLLFILSPLNAIHALISCSIKIFQVVSFSQIFQSKPYMCPPPTCTTHPVHLIPINLITQIIFGDITNHEALHYTVFSTLSLLLPS